MSDETIERRVAKLEGERVRGQEVTVTAVDTATSTFSAALPDGAGEVDGIASPLAFLPSPDDTVELDLHGATPVYRPARMTEQDTVTLNDLSVTGDPLIMGETFSEHIAPKSSFQAGASRGALTDPANTGVGGGETGLFEATFEFEPGVLYEITTSNIWVRPGQTTTTRIDLNIRYTVTGTRGASPPAVSLASPYFMRWPQAVDATFSTIGHGVKLGKLFKVPVYSHYRFILSLASFGGSAYIEMNSETHVEPITGLTIEPEVAQIYVNSGGAHPWTNRAQTNTGSGTPAAVVRETRYYEPKWTRWFRGDGTVQANSGSFVQGYNSNYPERGDQASQIGDFERDGAGNDIATDLAGTTIEKLELWLYAARWGAPDGGTVDIKYHTNATAGTLTGSAGLIAAPVGESWKAAQGRWVDITAWASLFQAGTAKGIQIGPAGSNAASRFGTFRGHAQAEAPVIRATFTR